MKPENSSTTWTGGPLAEELLLAERMRERSTPAWRRKNLTRSQRGHLARALRALRRDYFAATRDSSAQK